MSETKAANKNSKESKKKNLEWVTNSNDFSRKYRSKKLSDVVGQTMIKATIKGWVRRKQIPGAIMIHGQLGSGKTTFARLIAAILNCEHLDDDGNPCLECSSCQALYSKSGQIKHPDYMEVNASLNTGVDNVRQHQEQLNYKPRYQRRVIVYDEVHRLSKNGQDALLKELEDTKEHVTYILLTTDKQSLLDTVVSRCAVLRISEVGTEDNVKLMRRVCKAEGVSLGDEVLEMIAAKSGNIPRSCLTTLQVVVSALASGDLKEKDITVGTADSVISELVGAPNYIIVNKFLVALYSGSLAKALEILAVSASKPLLLKGCIDTHSLVIAAMSCKSPDKIITNKWMLGNISKLCSEAGIKRSAETMKLLSSVLYDMVDTYTKISQYQLGESAAPFAMLASKWCSRFKNSEGE